MSDLELCTGCGYCNPRKAPPPRQIVFESLDDLTTTLLDELKEPLRQYQVASRNAIQLDRDVKVGQQPIPAGDWFVHIPVDFDLSTGQAKKWHWSHMPKALFEACYTRVDGRRVDKVAKLEHLLKHVVETLMVLVKDISVVLNGR